MISSSRKWIRWPVEMSWQKMFWSNALSNYVILSNNAFLEYCIKLFYELCKCQVFGTDH